jgi:hypothetical protein
MAHISAPSSMFAGRRSEGGTGGNVGDPELNHHALNV